MMFLLKLVLAEISYRSAGADLPAALAELHTVIPVYYDGLAVLHLVNIVRTELHARQATYACLTIDDWVPTFSHFSLL